MELAVVHRNQKILPYLALAFSILVLGFSAIFVRWADAPGSIMAFYRLGMATIILTPIYFFGTRNQKKHRLGWKILVFPIIAGVMTAMDHTIWSSAIQYTSAANATLLNYTAPVWVALVAWLYFKERLRRLFWFGLLLALVGMAVVSGADILNGSSAGKGNLMALVSSFFFAGYFLATQSGRKHLDTLSYTWMVGISSTITLFIVNLILRTPFDGYPVQSYWAFLGAALFSQVGGYLAISYALGHLPASVVSPTMIGQPVLTALLALPLLGEALVPAQIVGGLMAMLGIYWVNRGRDNVDGSESP
jgi:drug/metabolite transporter (DMT)-like permease